MEPITFTIALSPFKVPNFVDSDPVELPLRPLEALGPVTLGKLCDRFRADVFAKAKLTDPADKQLYLSDAVLAAAVPKAGGFLADADTSSPAVKPQPVRPAECFRNYYSNHSAGTEYGVAHPTAARCATAFSAHSKPTRACVQFVEVVGSGYKP